MVCVLRRKATAMDSSAKNKLVILGCICDLDANGCDVKSLKRMLESSLALGSIPRSVIFLSKMFHGIIAVRHPLKV